MKKKAPCLPAAAIRSERRRLAAELAAARAVADTAKAAAKEAKTEFRRAKQKYKEARRAAKKLRKQVKALKSDLDELAAKTRTAKPDATTRTKSAKRAHPAPAFPRTVAEEPVISAAATPTGQPAPESPPAPPPAANGPSTADDLPPPAG